MAQFDVTPPFPRGKTALSNIGTLTSTDAANLVGRVVTFPDMDWSANPATPRSEHLVHCLIVRNTSGARLLPRFLAQVDTTYHCAGYTATTGGEGYPIDEFLPPTGVAANDLFYVVIGGPAKCLLDIAATNGNLISVGDWISALTAAASTGATSGATSNNITAGRVQMERGTVAALLATTSQAVDYGAIIQIARNTIGKAMSAATTNSTGLRGATNGDTLVGSPLVFVTQRWKFCL